MDKIRPILQTLIVWVFLVCLSALLCFVLYRTILIGGVWLNNSEQFRPRYWNFTRLKWLGKFTGVVVIGGWIFFMAYVPQVITTWRKYNIIKQQTIKISLLLLGVTLFLLLVAQLFVLNT